MGSFLAQGSRVSGKTVDQRCPDFEFLDPSLLPGASVSSSVKTDGFCSGAAGPVFCSLSLAFLECSAVGRRWKSGLRESRLRLDGLPVGNGEFDLQRVVTQEELVKRETPPGAMRGGGVHCCGFALERANFPDRAGASPGDCPLQGCLGSGFSRRPGANLRCCDLEAAPTSFGFCPGGPLVRESARLHAKLECAEETNLPHVVSDNFSKPGKLLEAGRPSRCVPLCGQRVGAKFCEPDLQNALVRMHGDPCVVAEVPGWRTSLRRRCVAAPPLKGGSGAVRPAQLAEVHDAAASSGTIETDLENPQFDGTETDLGYSVSENDAPVEDIFNGSMNTLGGDVSEPVVLGSLPALLLARPVVLQVLVVLLLDEFLVAVLVLRGQYLTLVLVAFALCTLHSALALRRVQTVLTILLLRFIHARITPFALIVSMSSCMRNIHRIRRHIIHIVQLHVPCMMCMLHAVFRIQ